MKKNFFIVLAIVAVASVALKIYEVYFNFRFAEISENKVYKSGVIPPDQLDDFVRKHKIKSIIDLRGPVTKDLINNPERKSEIFAEKQAASKIPGLNYYNIPSQQVPEEENLQQFFDVMDNQDNYPVLIHCYHGIGRAQMYSALYRIEYEGYSNEEARELAAVPLLFSSFDDGTPKGEYLKNYRERYHYHGGIAHHHSDFTQSHNH